MTRFSSISSWNCKSNRKVPTNSIIQEYRWIANVRGRDPEKRRSSDSTIVKMKARDVLRKSKISMSLMSSITWKLSPLILRLTASSNISRSLPWLITTRSSRNKRRQTTMKRRLSLTAWGRLKRRRWKQALLRSSISSTTGYLPWRARTTKTKEASMLWSWDSPLSGTSKRRRRASAGWTLIDQLLNLIILSKNWYHEYRFYKSCKSTIHSRSGDMESISI